MIVHCDDYDYNLTVFQNFCSTNGYRFDCDNDRVGTYNYYGNNSQCTEIDTENSPDPDTVHGCEYSIECSDTIIFETSSGVPGDGSN